MAKGRGLSPKIKKLIIALVVLVVAMLAGLAGFSVFSKISTVIVSDLRIVEHGGSKEIFTKDVYLTAQNSNYFRFDVSVNASGMTSFVAKSSDPSVASVQSDGDSYVVLYYKVGKCTVTVYSPEEESVQDSFVLNVKENYPLGFELIDEKAISTNEVSIFADAKEYAFDFKATSTNKDIIVNNDCLSVVEDYNQNVFESIKIDSATSRLIIKARQSEETTTEYITITARTSNGESSRLIGNFTIKIDVHGNYISDMQLMASTKPNFEGTKYIVGNGKINEGEVRVEANKLVLTRDVNIIYVKVRIVYTNGEMFDVTKDAATPGVPAEFQDDVIKPQPSLEYYFIRNLTRSITLTFTYAKEDQAQNFTFTFLREDSALYKDFINNDLYRKVQKDDGTIIYEYKYWDERFKRDDEITYNGEIIGFKNGDPTCESHE